jgi:hypothetical protein
MATYTVLSVDVLPPCERGNRHVAKASLMVDGGAAGTPRIAELLAMAAAGDTFVVGGGSRPGSEIPAAFVPCACGNGYLLDPGGMVDEYAARL